MGQRYRKQVSTYDGFGVYNAHEDCDEVAAKLTELARPALCDDETIMLHDIGNEDQEWISKEYPAVAERLWPTRQSA